MTHPPVTQTSHRAIRWWPALLVGALTGATVIWIWAWMPASSRQERVLTTMSVAAISTLLLFIWFLFLSRLRGITKLLVLGTLAGLGILGALTLEIRSFSGDVVPKLSWKWSPEVDEALEPVAGTGHAARAASSRPGEGDFPQFLGANRNATVDGIRLARDWQANPPQLLWRRDVGAGNAGFAVVGGIAVTHEQRGSAETVVAYDLETGEPLWSHGDEARHEDVLGGDGPRATPTIADGAVYSLGATGILNRLDLATGQVSWSRNVLTDADARRPDYGVSASPLIVDDTIVILAGGEARNRGLTAYDRTTGEPVWSGGELAAAYSSPLRATLAGIDQIVVFHGGGLSGHDLQGRALWQASWPPTERTSQPVVLPGSQLFVSSGYGVGSALFEIAPGADGDLRAIQRWANANLKAKFTQVVHRNDHLYGLDDGILVSVSVETGERAWKRGRYGHGQTLLVDDLLVILSEKGEVALVEATPKTYNELGRFQAIEGRTWNTPALAGRHLLVRNHRQAACYALPLAGD